MCLIWTKKHNKIGGIWLKNVDKEGIPQTIQEIWGGCDSNIGILQQERRKDIMEKHGD